MSDTSQDKEPSIDEILASIRQIISDDEEDGQENKEEEDSPEKVAEETPSEPEQDEPAIESQDDIDAMFDTAEEPEEGVGEEEILELTEKVEEDGTISDGPEDAEMEVDLQEDDPEPAPEPPLEPEPAPEPPLEPEPAPEPPLEPEPKIEAPDDLDTEILTQGAAAATLAGFTKLARDIQVNRSFEGVTLEDIVRGQLDPLLREWLDKNLPDIVERLVREELEKISKKAAGE